MRVACMLLVLSTTVLAEDSIKPDYGGYFEPENDANRKKAADLAGKNLWFMHNALHKYGSTKVRLLRDYRYTEVELDLSEGQVDELNGLADPDKASVGTAAFGERGNPYAVPEKQFKKYTAQVEARLKREYELVEKAASKILKPKQLARLREIGFQRDYFHTGNYKAAFAWHDRELTDAEEAAIVKSAVEDAQKIAVSQNAFRQALVQILTRKVIGESKYDKLAGDIFGFGVPKQAMEVAIEQTQKNIEISLLPNGQNARETFGPKISYPPLLIMPGVMEELKLPHDVRAEIHKVATRHRDTWQLGSKDRKNQRKLAKQLEELSDKAIGMLDEDQQVRLEEIRFQYALRAGRISKTFEERNLGTKKAEALLESLARYDDLVKLHLQEYRYDLRRQSLSKTFPESDVHTWTGAKFPLVKRNDILKEYGEVTRSVPYVSAESQAELLGLMAGNDQVPRQRPTNPRHRR